MTTETMNAAEIPEGWVPNPKWDNPGLTHEMFAPGKAITVVPNLGETLCLTDLNAALHVAAEVMIESLHGAPGWQSRMRTALKKVEDLIPIVEKLAR